MQVAETVSKSRVEAAVASAETKSKGLAAMAEIQVAGTKFAAETMAAAQVQVQRESQQHDIAKLEKQQEFDKEMLNQQQSHALNVESKRQATEQYKTMVPEVSKLAAQLRGENPDLTIAASVQEAKAMLQGLA